MTWDKLGVNAAKICENYKFAWLNDICNESILLKPSIYDLMRYKEMRTNNTSKPLLFLLSKT